MKPRFYAARDGKITINGQVVRNPNYLSLRFFRDGKSCTQIVCDFDDFDSAKEMAKRLNQALGLSDLG